MTLALVITGIVLRNLDEGRNGKVKSGQAARNVNTGVYSIFRVVCIICGRNIAETKVERNHRIPSAAEP